MGSTFLDGFKSVLPSTGLLPLCIGGNHDQKSGPGVPSFELACLGVAESAEPVGE
jgi:hypothetical protein